MGEVRSQVCHLISHRWSGSHFLRDLIQGRTGSEAGPEDQPREVRVLHESWTPESASELERARTVYLLRDGRDVLVASYRACSDRVRDETDFGGFLRGRMSWQDATVQEGDFFRAYLADPVRYWINHTVWADHLFSVRYEDLAYKRAATIERLAAHLGVDGARFERAGDRPGNVAGGRWRSSFSEGDHDYFWTLAGERMRQLGYGWVGPGHAESAERVQISRICYINLDRRRDRSQWLRESLAKAGVTDCSRVAAIDGRRYGTVDEVLGLVDMRMNDHFVRTRSDYSPEDPRFRAKAACWASHYRAIADIRADSGWTVILEDDVRIDFSREVLVKRLCATVSERPEVDMVVLSQRRGIANEGGRPREGGRRGTDGYALRNASAPKVLALFRTEAGEMKAFGPDRRFAELDRCGELCITSLSGGPWLTCLEVGPERDSDLRNAGASTAFQDEGRRP